LLFMLVVPPFRDMGLQSLLKNSVSRQPRTSAAESRIGVKASIAALNRCAPKIERKLDFFSNLLSEQRFHKLFGIEGQQISGLFTNADIAHRQAQFARDRDHHAAFCRAVELG
jgi:hypothetical protein